MASGVDSFQFEYRMFCADCDCGRSDRDWDITRCATCKLFAFCLQHRNSKHPCTLASPSQGSQLRPMRELIKSFRDLHPKPYSTEPVRCLRLVISDFCIQLETPCSSTDFNKPPAYMDSAIQRISEQRNRSLGWRLTTPAEQARDHTLLLEVRMPSNDEASTLLLMRPFPIPEARKGDQPTEAYNMVQTAFPRGQCDYMTSSPLWRYENCLVCGKQDSGVTACFKCDLLMHRKCAASHIQNCNRIVVGKTADQGADPNIKLIANYLCSYLVGVPDDSRVLYADRRRKKWVFLSPEEVKTTLDGPFGEHVASVLSVIEPLGKRVLVAVYGVTYAEQKVMVLTRITPPTTPKNCIIS